MDFQTIKFIVISAIIYGALHWGYHNVPDDYLKKTVYPNVIGYAAGKTINVLTPDRYVKVEDNRIISKKAVLQIVRGCDGSGVWFMLIAAVLGFGARFKETLVGLILGSLVVYVVNQVRIVGLYYVVEHNRMWFPAVHTYYAPTLIVFIIAIFFLLWTRWCMNNRLQESS